MRLLSAFLFAVTAMIVGYVLFWYVSVMQVENNVGQILETALKGNISFSSISKKIDPTRVHLVLHGLKYTARGDDNATYVHEIGDVDIITDFMSGYGFDAYFPKKQVIKSVYGDDIKTYDLLLEGGKASYYPKRGSGELLLSANTLVMAEQGAGSTPLVKSGYTYLIRSGSYGSSGWTFVSTNADVSALFPNIIPMQSVKLSTDISRAPRVSVGSVLPVLLSRNPDNIKEFVSDTLSQMVDRDTLLTIQDANIHFSNDLWFSLSGDVKIDDHYAPEIVSSLTTNRLDAILDYFRENKVVMDMPYEKDRMLKKLLSKNKDSLNLTVNINRRAFLVNGSNSGYILTVPELLGLEEPKPYLADE